MIISVYPLTETQTKKIEEINSETKAYAVVCDYGYGLCISSEIQSLPEFHLHFEYVTKQGIQEIQIEIPDED
jgi:hypothetical protein